MTGRSGAPEGQPPQGPPLPQGPPPPPPGWQRGGHLDEETQSIFVDAWADQPPPGPPPVQRPMPGPGMPPRGPVGPSQQPQQKKGLPPFAWAGIGIAVGALIVALALLQPWAPRPTGTVAATPSTAPAPTEQPASTAPAAPATTVEVAPTTTAPPTQAPVEQATFPPSAKVCNAGSTSVPLSGSAVGNDVTSCPFAESVRAAYLGQSVRNGTVMVSAYSSVTGRSYAMTCSGSGLVTCSGGNNALVYLR